MAFIEKQQRKLSALILAAGKGTRMKSEKAKVLHDVFFAPMIHHVLDAVMPLFDKTILVVGHQGDQVRKAVSGYPVVFAEQKVQLGTAHAVLAAEEHLSPSNGTVMILCGDTPLIRTETLEQMLSEHFTTGASLSVMTTILDNPRNYGRIITDGKGNITRIVEEKDAGLEQQQIREVNAGIYCAEIGFLQNSLRQIGTANKQAEFYLTDIVEIAVKEGRTTHRFLCSDPEEILGVNSRRELAQAHVGLQHRYNQRLMDEGVTLLQPDSIFIEQGITVGRDTVIHPGVHMWGDTIVGCNCQIEPFVVLRDTVLSNRSRIGAFSHLAGTRINQDESVPAYTNIDFGLKNK